MEKEDRKAKVVGERRERESGEEPAWSGF